MARSQRALRRARHRYVEIYRGRDYRLGKATSHQFVLDQRPQPQYVEAEDIIAHISAEARIRGDLDRSYVEAISDYLKLLGNRTLHYSMWADTIDDCGASLVTPEAKRTCNALAHYIRRYGRGWSPSSVAIVARYSATAA